MKKIFYYTLSLLLTIAMTACEDDFNRNNFAGYDDLTRPQNVTVYDYTISAGDIGIIAKELEKKQTSADSLMAKNLKKEKMFSRQNAPSQLIPYLLKNKYKTADINSAANVTYPYQTGRSERLIALSSEAYTLSDRDYRLVWGEGTSVSSLTPSQQPSTAIPNVLTQEFSDAIEGQQQFVVYHYSADEPIKKVDEVKYLNENFDKHGFANRDAIAIDGWKNVATKGKRTWEARTYNDNFYTQLSAFGSKEENEAWLITPTTDLKDKEKATFSFEVKTGHYNAPCLSVYISKAYQGDVAATDWEEITDQLNIPTPAEGQKYSEWTKNSIDLAKYKDEKITIAFKYSGDANNQKTTTIQIDNITISEKKETMVVENATKHYALFAHMNGEWKENKNVLLLQPTDYQAMGVRYLKVSTAASYIDAWLSTRYPYAQPNDKQTVVYTTRGTGTYADDYTYVDGKWSADATVVSKTDQFLFTGFDKKGWVFDPTIRFTLSKSDYLIVVNHQRALEKSYSKYDNSENYYGFSGHYGNVSYREIDRQNDPTYPKDATADKKLKFMEERTIEGLAILLAEKLPDATPTVDGLVQYAKPTIQVYDGSRTYYEYTFKCVDTRKWEYVDRVEVLP